MRLGHSRGFLALGLMSALMSALVLAGCGASGYGGYGGYGPGAGGSAGGTPTTGSSGGATVATSTVSVGGQSKTILTNAAGRTLYYFDNDTATSSACKGTCASIWPPLLIASGSPTSASSLPGTLTAADVGHGQQVLYNGHPLYTYSADSASGDIKGDGVQGKWHIATPDVAVNSASSAGQPTPTECTGYYCY